MARNGASNLHKSNKKKLTTAIRLLYRLAYAALVLREDQGVREIGEVDEHLAPQRCTHTAIENRL